MNGKYNTGKFISKDFNISPYVGSESCENRVSFNGTNEASILIKNIKEKI